MNKKLHCKNIAVNLKLQERRGLGFVASMVSGLIALTQALRLPSPILVLGAFLLLLAACSSSDITRTGEADGGNGQSEQQLLLDDFEPGNGPCALSDKWSSWGKGLQKIPSSYGNDPPDKPHNPEGGNCYLKVIADNSPNATYPGTVMLYIAKNVDPNSYLTFDLRIDQTSSGSAQDGQLIFEIVDDDNVSYKINIDLTNISNGGDDLFASLYTNTTASINDWVRVSIPLGTFSDTNSTVGDNKLNTGSTSSTTNTSDAGPASDAGTASTTPQNNGGLLAVRISPRDPQMTISLDNLRITSTNESRTLVTSGAQQNTDAGTDADVVESPDGDQDAGPGTDGGTAGDGGIDSGTDGEQDSGPAVSTTPPYMIDDSEGPYSWYTWGGATSSFVLSGTAPVPPIGLNLGSYVLSAHGTVNNAASYGGGIGRYNGRSATGTDFLTFSVTGQGAFKVIIADHDDGVGIDYFQSTATFSSDTGQYALHGWRTISVALGAGFALDTQQNTYTGDPLGDGTFNPVVSPSSDGLQKVHFTMQANSDAPSNSQVHLYFDNVRVTTDDQGDGIADIVIPDSSPFEVDNFDDGNYNSNPAWFSGDGMTIDIVDYALAGIVPLPSAGTNFVTLHGSVVPAALYGGYFGTYVGKKVSPLNDLFKFLGWDLTGRLTITLEFELEDHSTRQFTYSYEDSDLPSDPGDISIPLTAFTDDADENPTTLPAIDGDGNRTLKNIVFSLGKTLGDVIDTIVSLDRIRIEP